jgi:nucleolar protein 58
VEDITALQEGKIGKGLKQFLTDEVLGKGKGKDSLLVLDPHLCSYYQTSSYNGQRI